MQKYELFGRPVRFSQSARKHKIGRAHAIYVMQKYEAELVIEEGEEPKLRWVGRDDRGLWLTVVTVVRPHELFVIHVMPDYKRLRSVR